MKNENMKEITLTKEQEIKAMEERKSIARQECYKKLAEAFKEMKELQANDKALNKDVTASEKKFSEALQAMNSLTINHLYDQYANIADFLRLKVWAKWAVTTENKVEKLGTNNERLNVCNFLQFKSDNFEKVDNAKDFLTALDSLTIEVIAIVTDEITKEEVKTGSTIKALKALDTLLEKAGYSFHGRKKDIRFLKMAVTKVSNKNLGKLTLIKREQIAKYLPDIIAAIDNKKEYAFESEKK